MSRSASGANAVRIVLLLATVTPGATALAAPSAPPPARPGVHLASIALPFIENVGQYDALQSSYLAGPWSTTIAALAVLPSTAVYVAGFGLGTWNSQWVECGVYSGLAPDLRSLQPGFSVSVRCGYDAMELSAIAINPVNGNLYMAGTTNFSSLSAPGAITINPTTRPPNSLGFVGCILEVSPDGYHATFVAGPGSGMSAVQSLAIDPLNGDVLAAGYTGSCTFPAVSGGAQTDCSSPGPFGRVAFLARLSPDLEAFVQSTYLAGTSNGQAAAVAVAAGGGNVYVAGSLSSPGLPAATGGAQPAFGGAQDGFVACLSADLKTIVRWSYLGGTSSDSAVGLALHPTTGDVYVVGVTNSADVPGTQGSAQASMSGTDASFVASLDSGLSVLKEATYFAGQAEVEASAIAIDPGTGDVFIVGETNSADLPGTQQGLQEQLDGTWDGFVARFSPDLRDLIQATYLGGSGDDSLSAVAVDSASGVLYVAGQTTSLDFPGVAGGYQATFQGTPPSGNGVVARMPLDLKLHQPEVWRIRRHLQRGGP